jgi:predicted RNase H-like HicB family nuclease
MEYLIIIEKSRNGFGAYAPDLPGVGVVAETRQETLKLIKEAIELHIEDLKSSGKRLPKRRNEAVSILV